jgi:hypothetical protein
VKLKHNHQYDFSLTVFRYRFPVLIKLPYLNSCFSQFCPFSCSSCLEILKLCYTCYFKRSHLLYDKKGDEHYNIISAMHKSIRASDDNAALYWVTRMLQGGEDPLFIARRLVRAASEDIGKSVWYNKNLIFKLLILF